MEYKVLGKTGFLASRLCFGSLTLGPLQRNMSVEAGAKLIVEAYNQGINIIDTAELYDTYKYINKALRYIPREKYFIIAKSYAYDRKTAEFSLNKALREIGVNYLDGFLLHEQEGEFTLKGHKGAIDYFLEQKKKGVIKNFGISTHYVAGVMACVKRNDIDIIHPLVNMDSIGIQDGNVQDMMKAIGMAKDKDIGIYSMKALGGGNLISKYKEALNFVLNLEEIDSIAIGMQSVEEIEANVSMLSSRIVPYELEKKLSKINRKVVIDSWCIGCGNCERKCAYNAIKLVNGKAMVDRSKCLVCSYCAGYCPEFCIKVI
ncbi:MAG: aldo/keto reductase [Filifactoraceae bacterium]